MVVAIIAIIAPVFAFVACDNGSGNYSGTGSGGGGGGGGGGGDKGGDDKGGGGGGGGGTQGLYFELINNNTAYRVYRGTVTTGEVVIPATYNGKPVTEIGQFAFYYTSLTGITIPASITSIDNFAFRGCTNLTSVTFASGSQLETIAVAVFRECTSLTSITIPASVRSIDQEVFYQCTSLTGITLHEGLTSIEANAFSLCTSIASITIPVSVTYLGSFAGSPFFGWTASQTIHIMGHANEASADAALDYYGGSGWRHLTNATIVYHGE